MIYEQLSIPAPLLMPDEESWNFRADLGLLNVFSLGIITQIQDKSRSGCREI